MASRAVHLEMAKGLDTDAFLNAFYKMASRRGLPEDIFLDSGSNFKGEDAELRSLVSNLYDERIKQAIADKVIRWHFNPKFASHFGGVHETMIESAKKALYMDLGKAEVNDEELMVLIIGVESYKFEAVLPISKTIRRRSTDSKSFSPWTNR